MHFKNSGSDEAFKPWQKNHCLISPVLTESGIGLGKQTILKQ